MSKSGTQYLIYIWLTNLFGGGGPMNPLQKATDVGLFLSMIAIVIYVTFDYTILPQTAGRIDNLEYGIAVIATAAWAWWMHKRYAEEDNDLEPVLASLLGPESSS
jgi:drug/metabolite transporter superfamily protein YnfA